MQWQSLFFALWLAFICNIEVPSSADAMNGGEHVKATDDLGKYVVAIRALYTKGGSVLSETCTGALIAPRVVLTAAHCIGTARRKDFTQVYFVFNAGSFSRTPPAKVRNVVRYILANPQLSFFKHQGGPIDGPHVHMLPLRYDLALLKLDRPAPEYTRHFQVKNAKFEVKESNKLYAAGFGPEDYNFDTGKEAGDRTLKVTQLPPLDSTTSVRSGRYMWVMPEGTFYFGNESHHACIGDSGSPVFYETEGEYVLAGITSTFLSGGDRKHSCMGPGSISVDVSLWEDWIAANTRRLSGDSD